MDLEADDNNLQLLFVLCLLGSSWVRDMWRENLLKTGFGEPIRRRQVYRKRPCTSECGVSSLEKPGESSLL